MLAIAVSMSAYGLVVLNQFPPADVRLPDSRIVLIWLFLTLASAPAASSTLSCSTG